MKDIDELFKSVEKLSPPDSLKRRIMDEIRAGEPVVKSGWRERISDWLDIMTLHPARMGFAIATVAIALAVSTTFQSSDTDVMKHAPAVAVAVDVNEINDFMVETIGSVYSVRSETYGTAAVEQEDVADFVKGHVEPAFWINGGLDNA